MRIILIFLLLFSPLAVSADVEDRVGRLERTIELLQRKLLTQGANSPIPGSGTAALSSPRDNGSAAYELRISTLEEQLRDLHGLIERLEYRQQKQEIELQKLLEDVEYRLQQLEPSALEPLEEVTGADENTAAAEQRQAAVFEPATRAAKNAANAQRGAAFESPRAHYDHAFKLLGSGDYAKAAESFGEFTTAYPKDNLVGNAYYWRGETYYVRSDYIRAAEQFRLGFEKLPKGPKSHDNLLKLGMSLSQIQKEREACVVFKQLVKPSTSVRETIRRRAEAESERIACK